MPFFHFCHFHASIIIVFISFTIFLPKTMAAVAAAAMSGFNPNSQRKFRLPQNHLGGHGPYKEILHGLKENAVGLNEVERDLVDLGYLHDAELHGLKAALGTAQKDISLLNRKVQGVEKELDAVAVHGGNTGSGNASAFDNNDFQVSQKQ
jgi:hypothetical protein